MALEKIKLIHGSPEWLAFRRTGIGASEAAAHSLRRGKPD